MNRLSIIGNLVRDPEVRTANTSNGQVTVCSFTVAVNRKGKKDEADFFRVTAWRGLGEVCGRYLAKGRKVYASGPVSVRTYQAQDGSTKASLELQADEVEFLSTIDHGDAYEPPEAEKRVPLKEFMETSSEGLPF